MVWLRLSDWKSIQYSLMLRQQFLGWACPGSVKQNKNSSGSNDNNNNEKSAQRGANTALWL